MPGIQMLATYYTPEQLERLTEIAHTAVEAKSIAVTKLVSSRSYASGLDFLRVEVSGKGSVYDEHLFVNHHGQIATDDSPFFVTYGELTNYLEEQS